MSKLVDTFLVFQDPSNGDNWPESERACEGESQTPEQEQDEKEQKSCDDDLSPEEKALVQRKYHLQELLESELTYVQDLEQCVDYIKYMRESKDKEEADIPMPEDLKAGKDRMVFGNIEAIFEWHRDFFRKNLEKCIKQPLELGQLFKKSERKFQMYVVYCQNKPKSEFIVSEYIDNYFEEIRHKLGFKLRLTDLLIVGALIEARSCERFAKLAPYLDDTLQTFYLSLLKSEARHYQDYLALAEQASQYYGELTHDRVSAVTG